MILCYIVSSIDSFLPLFLSLAIPIRAYTRISPLTWQLVYIPGLRIFLLYIAIYLSFRDTQNQ